MPGSLKYLINALFLGKPLNALNKHKQPSSKSCFCSFLSNPSCSDFAIFVLASVSKPLTNFLWLVTNFSTFGFNATYSCSSPFGTGPEIINGVLASSTKTESTSSIIA